MMRVLKILGIIAAVILIVFIVLAWFYGAFAKVVVEEKQTDAFWMVYTPFTGPYNKVGPVMQELDKDLRATYSITSTRGFGLYYDDPKQAPAEKCRSIVGNILEPGDMPKIEELKKKYFVREYPAAKSVVAEFPFKGLPSIIIGISRVYPKLGEYMMQNNLPGCPMFEIYDIPGKKITYGASTSLNKAVFDSFLEKEAEPVIEEVGQDSVAAGEEE